MRLKFVIIVYTIFGVLLFATNWFFWDIIDIITPFLAFIPVIACMVLALIFLIGAIIYIVKNVKAEKWKAFIPLAILAASLTMYVTFPFTKVRLDCDFKLNLTARNQIIDMIKTGKLMPEEKNKTLITLPQRYKHLSKGGGEVMVEKHSEHQVYLFFTYRGILDNYSGFVYDPAENAQAELCHEYVEVERLGDCWYFCASN